MILSHHIDNSVSSSTNRHTTKQQCITASQLYFGKEMRHCLHDSLEVLCNDDVLTVKYAVYRFGGPGARARFQKSYR